MVLPPDWAGSCTADSFVAHYAAAAAEIPVMVVTNVFSRSHELGLAVLRRLRDEVPGVVAIKDDLVGVFARKMALLLHGRWAIISGGQKQNHFDLVHYGVRRLSVHFCHFCAAGYAGVLAGCAGRRVGHGRWHCSPLRYALL